MKVCCLTTQISIVGQTAGKIPNQKTRHDTGKEVCHSHAVRNDAENDTSGQTCRVRLDLRMKQKIEQLVDDLVWYLTEIYRPTVIIHLPL